MIEINPVALDLWGLQIRWYGILYLLSFLLGYRILLSRRKIMIPAWTKDQVSDLVFFIALGIIFGGRVGFLLLYSPETIIAHPLSLIEFWQPGRSFHGGLLGVLLSVWVFTIKYHLRYVQVTDFFVPVVPIGIIFGRLGNFINGELWGRVTDSALGMVFPYADALRRHPSSLYELVVEGILLYFVVDIVRRKTMATGTISATFLVGYGIARFATEYFREPDYHIGFVVHHFTMGQLLSLPMIMLGLVMLLYLVLQARSTR